VNVYFGDEQDEPADGAALRQLACGVLEDEGLPSDTEMSLILVDPEQMAGYNEQFMDRSGPTDVLAFPLLDMEASHPPRRIANEPPIALGDVFLCPAFIAERARSANLSEEDYGLRRLAVHGILHLLGYGHDDDASAMIMERREDDLLDRSQRGEL
jgi:probable rRNA maturation factor